jgi:hypothetical protein
MNLPIIDVSHWESPDDTMYPPGARDKQILISPLKGGNGFINGHYYMFKESVNRHPEQFWCEVIAYHIGMMVEVDVPVTYPAIWKNKNGALIEWFLSINGEQRLIHGAEYMKMLYDDYDIDKGKQHNFEGISKISRALKFSGYLNDDWNKHWVKLICFDVIIGNTDRHHSNWGVIFDKSNKIKFTPAYDNGTALGYEIIERNIQRFNEQDYLINYIGKGQHHMKWSQHDDFSKVKGENHFEMLIKLCNKYKNAKDLILGMLPSCNKIDNFRQLLYEYSKYNMNVPLTEERCNFIFKLVKTRCGFIKDKIAKC